MMHLNHSQDTFGSITLGRGHDPKMAHRFKQIFIDFFTIRPSAGVKMHSFDEQFYKE